MSEKCGNHNGGMETIKNRNSRTEKYSTIPKIKNSLEQRKRFLFLMCRIPATSGMTLSRQIYM